MAQPHSTQIAIVGGGITGLWLMNMLGNQGYEVLLLEAEALGQAQTFASQGMIHGGIKYALGGFTTPASESIARMPELWRQCLAGQGPLPLQGVPVLSDAYYLFSDGSVSSRVTAFFGSKSLRGRVTPLARKDFPSLFDDPGFRGNVYQLLDMVVDTPALVSALVKPYRAHIYRSSAAVMVARDGSISGLETDQGLVSADYYIFAGGQGNAALLAALPDAPIKMQRRPLHQVMLKGRLPSAYAHGVSLRSAAKPRVTITSHPCEDGETVWYLGGQLAESGVDRSEAAQIHRAREELAALFPWIDTTTARWATLRVDRAEPANELQRPDMPFCQRHRNALVCWPTKLTLTPMLAEMACDSIDLLPSGNSAEPLDLPLAAIGKTPWELAF